MIIYLPLILHSAMHVLIELSCWKGKEGRGAEEESPQGREAEEGKWGSSTPLPPRQEGQQAGDRGETPSE
jgi:hypothetical protein